MMMNDRIEENTDGIFLENIPSDVRNFAKKLSENFVYNDDVELSTCFSCSTNDIHDDELIKKIEELNNEIYKGIKANEKLSQITMAAAGFVIKNNIDTISNFNLRPCIFTLFNSFGLDTSNPDSRFYENNIYIDINSNEKTVDSPLGVCDISNFDLEEVSDFTEHELIMSEINKEINNVTK